jgi:hypothetical protein
MNAPFRLDRAGLVLGLAVAAAYVALGATWPLALGASLLVYLLKLALDRPWQRHGRRTPPPDIGSPEALWLDRAGRALRSIRELRRSAHSDGIAQRCAALELHAEASVATLGRLAYQASVISGLARSREATSVPGLAGPTRHASADRLENTQLELYARIEASVIGLEGLVARLAEIVSLSESDVTSVDDLAFELETLRSALVETEELGRTSVHALIAPIERGGQ